jgi:hypothetical protein
MALRLSFDLRDADLERLEDGALRARAPERAPLHGPIIAAAREVLERGLQAHPATFVRERYARLREIIDMLADPEWALDDEDRQRVVNALACFASPPAQDAPAGVLDHATMIELASRDLRHDIDAYRDFCRFRESLAARRGAPGADREQRLAHKRTTLKERMRKRRLRELDATRAPVRKLFSLLRLWVVGK